jgi:hypothetical protein
MRRTKKGQTLDTFHPFSKLPIEIRFRVWNLMLPQPRYVKFEQAFYYTKALKGDRLDGYGVCSRMFIPVLLHVDQEPRRFTEKHYTKCLEDPLGHYIFIDFERDTLLLENMQVFRLVYGLTFAQWHSESQDGIKAYDIACLEKNIKIIALDEIFPHIYVETFSNRIKKMRSLQSIAVDCANTYWLKDRLGKVWVDYEARTSSTLPDLILEKPDTTSTSSSQNAKVR